MFSPKEFFEIFLCFLSFLCFFSFLGNFDVFLYFPKKTFNFLLIKKVQKMIEDIANELNLSEEELCQKSNLPLIRIRVEHSGFEVLNASAFGKKFLGKVANPIDILMFFKKNAGPRGLFIYFKTIYNVFVMFF